MGATWVCFRDGTRRPPRRIHPDKRQRLEPVSDCPEPRAQAHSDDPIHAKESPITQLTRMDRLWSRLSQGGRTCSPGLDRLDVDGKAGPGRNARKKNREHGRWLQLRLMTSPRRRRVKVNPSA
nr:unnamed protein product [Digitaria exilis]CAB3469890.1 unnamed protein product [Digitaria exilis]